MVYVDILSDEGLTLETSAIVLLEACHYPGQQAIFFSPYASPVHQVSLRAGHMMCSARLSIQYYHRSFRVLPVGLIRSMPRPHGRSLVLHAGTFGTFCFQNDLTGEHSCIMLRRPGDEEQSSEENWLQAYWTGEASSFTGGGGEKFLKVCTKEDSLLGKVHNNNEISHRSQRCNLIKRKKWWNGILPSPVGMDRCLREGLIWYNLSWVTYLRIHVCRDLNVAACVMRSAWVVLRRFPAAVRFASVVPVQIVSPVGAAEYPPAQEFQTIQEQASPAPLPNPLPPPSFPLPNSTSPTALLFPPSPCVLWFICLWSFFLFVCWSVRPFVLFRLEVCLLIRLFIYVWSFACRSLC